MKYKTKNPTLFYIGSFLISLLSAYFVWLQTSKYGIGLSPDSTTYLRWSESISKDGWGFIIQNPRATFPPLYPTILVIFSNIFHADHISIARWLNIMLSFCFSFSSLFLCRKLTKNTVILLTFGLFISFSRPLNLIFSYAWSEPLFIFLLLLITFSIDKTDYKHLILCGFLSALAILTRYAGVAIVPAVCLYIFMEKHELSEKIKKSFCYASIPTLTYIAYIARNYYFTKTLMGTRVASNTGLISNCDRAFSTIALWWFSGQYFFMVAFLLLISGGFIWNYRKNLFKFFADISGTIKFSFCFVAVYSAFIVISSTTTAYDLIDDRLMAPVFLYTLLLLFSLVVIGYKTPKKEKFLFYPLLSMLIVCTLISFAKTWTKDVNFRKNHGAGGYNSEFWQENNLVKYLKTNKLNSLEKIYTNDTYSFFIIDKKIKSLNIPLKKDRKVSGLENSLIIYFNNIDQKRFALNELQTICKTETIVENIDGFILRINKCSKPTNFENKNG